MTLQKELHTPQVMSGTIILRICCFSSRWHFLQISALQNLSKKPVTPKNAEMPGHSWLNQLVRKQQKGSLNGKQLESLWLRCKLTGKNTGYQTFWSCLVDYVKRYWSPAVCETDVTICVVLIISYDIILNAWYTVYPCLLSREKTEARILTLIT